MERSAETTVIGLPTATAAKTPAIKTPPKTWNMHSFTQTPVCSLEQVMSEELARALQADEEQAFKREIQITDEMDSYLDESATGIAATAAAAVITDEDQIQDSGCESDLILAQMLQAEFDKEHDDMLKTEEKKFNGSSKVTVSFVNYRKVPDEMVGNDDEDSSDDDIYEPRHLDSFDYAEKNSPTIGKNGISVSKHGNVITTKHDATICGHRNACRVMEFPPGIETGDGGGFDMKLSNSVFNKLKVYSASEEKRSKRVQDKVDKSTAVQVLDPKTRLLLFKLVNSEVLESIQGSISTGKESVVFHSFGGQTTEMTVPTECAIKVFKTTLNEFKNRDKYIREDFRFKDRFSKQNPRKIIRQWAEKEMHNLIKLKKCGVNCPEVVTLKKHVLVMSFIGNDQKPAPKLKDVQLSASTMQEAHQQVVEIMKKMYNVCKLVHADLSEYNILWHENLPWIIDVSQAVERNHPQALEFLLRDCTNVSSFFSKNGVPNVLTAEKLFTDITGLDVPGEGAEMLARLHDYERDQVLLTFGVSDKPYPFDSVFEKPSGDDEPSD